MDTPPHVLLDGLTFVESARWRDGRLWFAHWGSGEIVTVDMEGRSEVVADGPAGYGWSLDWLPDGQLLTSGNALTRISSDATAEEYGDLRRLASHGWNEITVGANGNVYVNGFAFDLHGGGAPQPGMIALVRPDGSAVQVADDLQFPNGMAITPDASVLIVAESFAGRLTAFDIRPDGTLTNRRLWAAGIAPDGICLDAEGAIWCGASDIQMMTGREEDPAGALIRVGEGGEITARVELDRPVFSCVLGGADGRTLFMLAAEWRGFDMIDATAAERTGQVLEMQVDVPAARSSNR